MTYTRGIGSTLNVVGMGVNRIGKENSWRLHGRYTVDGGDDPKAAGAIMTGCRINASGIQYSCISHSILLNENLSLSGIGERIHGRRTDYFGGTE
jgi:hypothetical protein